MNMMLSQNIPTIKRMEVLEGEYFELSASYDPTAFEFRVTWNGHWVGAYHIPSQDDDNMDGEGEKGISFRETTASGAMDIYYVGFTIDGEREAGLLGYQKLIQSTRAVGSKDCI